MTKFDFSVMETLSNGNDHRAMGPEREDSFRVKVSMQQFMNHNGPIFRAFAYKGISVREVADGDVLLGPTEAASALTRTVTTAILKDKGGDVTAKDLSFFRTEAANWVAERWLRGEAYDVDAVATSIVNAVKRADKEWDHDPFKDDRISNDASLRMSAVGVTARMMKQVEIYDFRVGRNEVLKVLLDEVIGMSLEVAHQMLPRASKNDTSNLVQTVSRNLASIMEAIYERKAREVVGLLNGRTEEQKVAWLGRHNPLETVKTEFKEWALCFVGFAMATSTMISSPNTQTAPSRNRTGEPQA